MKSSTSNTSKDQFSDYDPLVLARNMAEATFRTQHIASQFASKQAGQSFDTPFDPLNVAGAFSQFYGQLLSDPEKLLRKQSDWWQGTIDLWHYAAKTALGEEVEKPFANLDKDKRFKAEDWQQHTLFDIMRQSYALTSNWMHQLIHDTEGLDPKAAQKVEFYTRQLIDALSPSNYAMTNPEVLQATLGSNGENLLKGLKNFEHDLQSGKISMTDYNAFKVGKNLATTPGYVVHQNDLMELIQYTPTTKQVHEVPLLLMPAWINKFYIFDLQEKNSFVKWLTDQGYTVFVISWVNPDKAHAKKSFKDYMQQGPLTAIEVMQQRTNCAQVNVVGYCLGGTLLSMTLAYLHAKKKAKQVKSATYLTTMIDFAKAGDLSVFVDEAQISNMEMRMQDRGYLEGGEMAMTFNLLRANDLIWSFVVNNYLLGKEPFPFDLLYWNADATRMPAKMHSEYMRGMYLNNDLIKKQKITLDGVGIDVTSINTPSFILSTRDDHIAPWKSTYASTQLYGGEVDFVLAASGHIAGVMNSPAKNKYCYWESNAHRRGEFPENAEQWFETTKEKEGSWWGHWEKWLKKKSGKKVSARNFTAAEKKKFTQAPGKYVMVRS